MVESPLRDLHLIQNVLDGHLIVAFGVDQFAGNIQDFIAPGCIIVFFEDSGHSIPFNKPTVGLLIGCIICLTYFRVKMILSEECHISRDCKPGSFR
jgi:hypothetical protein